jgi:hypothetical protein
MLRVEFVDDLAGHLDGLAGDKLADPSGQVLLDADPEVHRVLTEKVFPRQADVVRIADWTASLA